MAPTDDAGTARIIVGTDGYVIGTVGNKDKRGTKITMEIPSITPDHPSKRHDLHPVVRGVASGELQAEEIDRYGQRVVDHFSERAYSPYDEAETLEDLRDGLYVVRTLLKMGRYRQACDAYKGDLSNALFFNLEARAEVLSLLQRPQAACRHRQGVLDDRARLSGARKRA